MIGGAHETTPRSTTTRSSSPYRWENSTEGWPQHWATTSAHCRTAPPPACERIGLFGCCLTDVFGALPAALAPAVVDVGPELAPRRPAHPSPLEPACTKRPSELIPRRQSCFIFAHSLLMLAPARSNRDINVSEILGIERQRPEPVEYLTQG